MPEAGVESFGVLDEHAEKFGRKIYGIEPGNNSNRMILEMIEKDAFGLSGWELIESSEQGMLAEVDRAIRNEKWIVFLGREPHPMNTRYDIAYLAGGDDYFGPNYGGAEVLTNIRTGYAEECPNAAKFVSNLRFTLDMENEMMGMILDEGMKPQAAAAKWLQKNSGVIEPWLDGGDARAAVRQELGL
ncbi:glycine betaine ABC transporter substrate-binding protein [Chelativorans sp. M5D2P16]|uniref:glycine betaine ABC transporter substrate-binding protein n=1 Tax=Chelativorans sp. M5D2P16 TaxID=3095678 RepID=UPI002ACA3D9E|nr:glycine betaine ABC transporter substrate-binding protein [Chelativorans sp. M5D2P16]MDZ5699951.1 glycine betaine ABC transporter substrate-binding protein [Chelativorans sp. M5D2P16]